MSKKNIFIAIVAFLCLPLTLFARQTSVSYTTNFTPQNYKSGTQNWFIAESNNGIMYFANNKGLLIKEGNSWRSIATPIGNIIRCINIVKEKIYVGGGKGLGYFERSPSGEYCYIDISHKLDNFNWGEAWRIINSEQYIYIQGGKGIIAVDIEKDSVINKISIKNSYLHYDQKELFLYNSEGIYKLGEKLESLTKLSGWEGLSNIGVRNIFTTTDRQIISTLSNGIFTFKDGKLSPILKPINKTLISNQIYSALQIGNNYIFGTILDGIYVTDKDFNVIEHINTKNGLKNNTILSLQKDSRNNLWAGLDYGLSYIELGNPLKKTAFDSELGTAYASLITPRYTYWGTNQGLFYTEGSSSIAQIIPGTQGQVWHLKQIGQNIICLHHNGLFIIKGNKAQQISKELGFNRINRISSTLFALSNYEHYNLYHLNPISQEFKLQTKLINSNLPKDFININSKIWYINKGIFCSAKLDTLRGSLSNIREYPTQSPVKTLHKYHDRVIFETEGELLEINSNNTGLKEIDHIMCTENDFKEILNLFLKSKLDNQVIYKYFHNSKSLLEPFACIKSRINYSHPNSYHPSYSENQIIFNGLEGFIGYSKQKSDTLNININSILAEACYRENKKLINISDKALDFSNNSVIFTFFSNDNRSYSNVEYSYMLKGIDKDFSGFTTSSSKEYTNLKEGNYCFSIIAKNESCISAPSSFCFKILPPFYRSNTAYFVYFTLMLILAYLTYRFIRFIIKRNENKILKEKQLGLEMMERNYKIELLNKENIIMTIAKEKLENDIYHKSQELTNSTHNIVIKNDLLISIKDELEKIYSQKDIILRDSALRRIIKEISSNINNKHDWEIFEEHFNEIHKDFFNNIKLKFPDISSTELKLCAFIRLNKSSKEIATLMNISIRGVETARYRLRKKLNIEREDNIHDIIMNM